MSHREPLMIMEPLPPTITEDEAETAPPAQEQPESSRNQRPQGTTMLRQWEAHVDGDVFAISGQSKYDEKQVDSPRQEQWRVGKTPGHQGSHSRKTWSASSSECLLPGPIGEKRSINEVSSPA